MILKQPEQHFVLINLIRINYFNSKQLDINHMFCMEIKKLSWNGTDRFLNDLFISQQPDVFFKISYTLPLTGNTKFP